MPNRILRDWTDSEKVKGLTAYAERFFTRLIMKVDDYGCYSANPQLLKSTLFPLLDTIRNDEVEVWLNECYVSGLVILYTIEGKKYLQIKDFRQRLRQARSKYPLPIDGHVTVNGRLEEKRNEEKEKADAPPFTQDFVEGTPEPKSHNIPATLPKPKIEPYKSSTLTKEQLYEMMKGNEKLIEDSRRLMSQRGWRGADEVDIVGILQVFVNIKAKMDQPPEEIQQHYQNWLFSEKLDRLTESAKIFKQTLKSA